MDHLKTINKKGLARDMGRLTQIDSNKSNRMYHPVIFVRVYLGYILLDLFESIWIFRVYLGYILLDLFESIWVNLSISLAKPFFFKSNMNHVRFVRVYLVNLPI